MNKTIVVTGSSGYIGGTICYLLKQKGYKVVAIDSRPQPHLHQYYDVHIVDDFCSYNSFSIIKNNEPAAIIHCAGTSLVGPSLHDPGPYFHNNLNKTQSLLDFLANEKINTKIIFSSSAAVYGDYDNSFDEYSETKPISPYGESKLMIETSLKWYKKIFGLDYVAFRYFNACGAVPGGIHGQEPDATHIFAKLFDAAIVAAGQCFANDPPTCGINVTVEVKQALGVTTFEDPTQVSNLNNTEGNTQPGSKAYGVTLRAGDATGVAPKIEIRKDGKCKKITGGYTFEASPGSFAVISILGPFETKKYSDGNTANNFTPLYQIYGAAYCVNS